MLPKQRTKYPRTPHLPWSPGRSSDDKVISSAAQFKERQVVVTVKMDGENTTMYKDGVHARSIDSGHHPSRAWVKAFQAQIGHRIPDGFRVCGENLFARHSIAYTNLPSYFLGFSVWERDVCLSWYDTVLWFDRLGICSVEVVWEGMWNENVVRNLTVEGEGYVVRLRNDFLYADFAASVAKYVKENHVQTDQHWMHGPVIPNLCRKKEPSARGAERLT